MPLKNDTVHPRLMPALHTHAYTYPQPQAYEHPRIAFNAISLNGLCHPEPSE